MLSTAYRPPVITELAFHEKRRGPPDSVLYASPRMTEDVVKTPYKEPEEKRAATGPQDLNYSRLFLVGDSPGSF